MNQPPPRAASAPPHIGTLPAGERNSIADVAGVGVGHCTLDEGDVQTGVTVLRPHTGDLYRDRVPAASVVLNGFGKSIGLVQLDELGLIDTPLALTNTYSVPAVATAMIRQCIAANPKSGRSAPTVNPVVLECNDGYLNDMQLMVVDERHYRAAHDAAGADFAQGAVGGQRRTRARVHHPRRGHRRAAGRAPAAPPGAARRGRTGAAG